MSAVIESQQRRQDETAPERVRALRGNQLEANTLAQCGGGTGERGKRQARILCIEQPIQRGATGVHLLRERRFSNVARLHFLPNLPR